jgi:hypothetical protein
MAYRTVIKLIFLGFLSIPLVGCMNNNASIEISSLQAVQAIGCTNFKSAVFDSMYSYLDTEKAAPTLSEFSESINQKIDDLAKKQKINETLKLNELKTEISNLYKMLIEKAAELKQVKTSKEHLQTIIELEMEDISTAQNVQLNTEFKNQFDNVETAIQTLDIQCGTSTTIAPLPPTSTPPVSKYTRMIAGSHNVFATAYQTCNSLTAPEINASTPNVVGITRLAQNHPDGIGGRRIVSDLLQVQKTHPYIQLYENKYAGCFNVKNNPLIYDYGGEPIVSNNMINFFQNNGTGTNALGVDCSAYVSSSIAAGGLRYKPGVDNKAIFIRQTSSKFINATSSGFSCFKNVTMTPQSSLLPGDIVSVVGHVVIVDRVGTDPFGLKYVNSISQCKALNISNFDFSVSQSSPSKNGVGLNRYTAKDYLNESSHMKEAFLGFAKASCEARFMNASVETPRTNYGIIRHTGTPDCVTPKIQLAYQSCVNSCML